MSAKPAVYIVRPEGLPAAFIVAADEDSANRTSRAIVDHMFMGTVFTGEIRDADGWLTAPVTRDAVASVPATESLCGNLNVYVITPGYSPADYRSPFRVLAADADAAEEAALTVLGGFDGDLRVQGQGPAPKWMFYAL